MAALPPPEGALYFTFDQVLYFARLTQQVFGATLLHLMTDSNGVETQEEAVSLPNDIHLVQAFQRLQGEAVAPDASPKSKSTVHLLMADMVISISPAAQSIQATRGDAFIVRITPCSDEEVNTPTQNQDLSKRQNTHQYHVFDDYLTSFVWAASKDGHKEEVLDDGLARVFSSSLAGNLRNWTDIYNTNFRLQGCDQGSGLDVFPTVPEIITWTIEGAILSTRMAASTGIAVVYSAYLRHGNEYRFVGKATRDAATLVDLVLRLNKYIGIVRLLIPSRRNFTTHQLAFKASNRYLTRYICPF
ncbi:hypothetical protein CPB84DRAFT_349197 [Gymnopilus junonius]|uniref:Uncharacterized protein n=1 Tax=Gymnopilus junonius TaxID=109634 RepID=A0A9P5TI96_GYMJU|nr:hypothetical protein CPB84DRAFT_349197 [Gymnopilus junonius]